jgi:hypothetical protein
VDAGHLAADGGASDGSARIGCVTRQGLAANIKAGFPRWVLPALMVLAMFLTLCPDHLRGPSPSCAHLSPT